MSRRLLRAATLLVTLGSSAARAEDVYVWTDASGESHYTNDIASIPEKAQRTVRKLEGTPDAVAPRSAIPGVDLEKPKPAEPEPAADAKKQPPPDQAPPPPQPIEEAIQPPREDEKVSEEQWRTMFRKANERVRRAERKAQRTREALNKLPGQDVTTTYDYAGNLVVDSRYSSLRVQLEEDEYQLNSAREELHDLERAAAREAVPLEWRR